VHQLSVRRVADVGGFGRDPLKRQARAPLAPGSAQRIQKWPSWMWTVLGTTIDRKIADWIMKLIERWQALRFANSVTRAIFNCEQGWRPSSGAMMF